MRDRARVTVARKRDVLSWRIGNGLGSLRLRSHCGKSGRLAINGRGRSRRPVKIWSEVCFLSTQGLNKYQDTEYMGEEEDVDVDGCRRRWRSNEVWGIQRGDYG